MIPKAITAPFRCWAKDPWRTFWGITLLGLFSCVSNLFSVIGDSLDFKLVRRSVRHLATIKDSGSPGFGGVFDHHYYRFYNFNDGNVSYWTHS